MEFGISFVCVWESGVEIRWCGVWNQKGLDLAVERASLEFGFVDGVISI